MYLNTTLTYKLSYNQLVIVYCPEWCDTGFVIAQWKGSTFESETDYNGTFNEYVESFLPLDEDGCPCKLQSILFYHNNVILYKIGKD